MNKILIFYLVLIAYCCLTISCKKGCYTRQIDSLELTTGHIIANREYYYLNSLYSPAELSRMTLGFGISAAQSHKVCHQLNLQWPSPIPYAHADEPDISYSSTVDLISITSSDTIKVAGEMYPPKSILTPLFEASDGYSFEEIGTFLQKTTRYWGSGEILLRFVQNPDHRLNHQFSFKVKMSDGVIFHLESDTINTD